VTYTLIWRNEGRRALSGLRDADPAAAKAVMASVRALAIDPFPATSGQLSQSQFWRLRLGELRVTYEADEAQRAVHIYNVGPVPAPRRRP
jgi:mRNA interferase RelE/StbE